MSKYRFLQTYRAKCVCREQSYSNKGSLQHSEVVNCYSLSFTLRGFSVSQSVTFACRIFESQETELTGLTLRRVLW